MSADDEVNAFDLACNTQTRVSQLLEDDATDVMTLSGPIGRFTYIGQGTGLEYLVKPALMGAISETIDEHVYVDDPDSVQQVQEEVQQQLQEFVDPFTAEHLAAETARTLEEWIEFHDTSNSGGDA